MNHFISVVIPSFNGQKLLQANLPSVLSALVHSGQDYEIIVADDCSTDDSLAYLREHFPQVTIIENTSNQGFSKNINTGLRRAQGSLVLALNNDVALDKDYFKYQLPFFESPDTFGVMGALCNPNTGKIEDGAKLCEQGWLGTVRSTRNLLPKDGSSLATFFLSGANALMDRKKISRLGFYDEIFSPFYNEDVELGIRAWRMGWKCYFEPRSKAIHSVSQTIKNYSTQRTVRFISLRNRFFMHDIHLQGGKRFFFFSSMFFSGLVRWMVADVLFYRAALAFLKGKRQSKRSRKQFGLLSPKFTLEQIFEVLRNEQTQKEGLIF